VVLAVSISQEKPGKEWIFLDLPLPFIGWTGIHAATECRILILTMGDLW
jgi:hypothetical protein